MGITKRQLFEDYYLDELPVLFEEYAALNGTAVQDEDTEDPRAPVETVYGLDAFTQGFE